jgi:sigma-B regulation protein RsbU (phosphoserine phosphatase)
MIQKQIILIVDDEKDILDLLEYNLLKEGYQVLKASDGEEALNVVRNNPVDLVLLDIMMPIMDGYEFCRAIRADEKLRNLPILIQSAVQTQDEKIKAFEVGATDLINKPINPKEFISRVNVHLQHRFLMHEMEEYRARVEIELAQAREMQKLIMPKLDSVTEIEQLTRLKIASHFETSTEMGGDFWGLDKLGSKHLSFYIVDFTGHGVAAALNTFRIHTLMQERGEFNYHPGEQLTKLNKSLYGLLAIGQFATMFYGVIDLDKNELRYAVAASTYPILYNNQTSETKLLKAESYPLGIKEDEKYETYSVPFNKGDTVVLYSDGLTEACNEQGEMFGEERILQMLANLKKGSVGNDILYSLLKKFAQHSSADPEDDLTINIYSRA